MRVALVQTDPVFAAKEENLRQALSMMESVKADLYVLPELFDSGYNFAEMSEVRQLADKFTSGRTFDRMSKFAAKAKCFVVYGFIEDAGDAFYNAAAIVGHDGTVGLYRKIHLFDREKLFFQPGDLGFHVYDTEIGKIGLMICFDWYFPESARTLALQGAQLIAHPSNLVLPNCPDGMRTRCLENRIFAVTANRVGTENRGGHLLSFIGQSQTTSPRGEIICRASSEKPEIVVSDISVALADDKQLTSLNHLFADRRPETYKIGII
jgi:5-aminopentanamidase